MENNYLIIKYLNNNEKILKFISESNKQFENRLLYIKKLESYNLPYKEAINLSKIWYSIKIKKCKYPLEIYNNVMLYDKYYN